MTDREADKAIKDFERKLRRLEKNVTATGKAMSVGFTAPFILAIGKAIQAYDEEAQASRKLQIALGGTSKALSDQASQIQKNTTYADDEIIAQQAWAAALGHTESQILDMTDAAVGLAAGLGMGLDEAMKALHQTTVGQTKTLGKLIPEIKSMTQEQLKSGAAIDLVKEKFKGYAEAAAMVGAGPLKQLKNSMGDLMEQIGQAALPIVVAFTEKLKGLAERLQQMDPETRRAALAFGALVAAVGPLLVILPKVFKILSLALSPVGLITAAVVALGAAAVYIAYNWNKFVEDWKLIWWDIKNIAVGVINDVIGAMNLLSKAVNPYQLLTGKDAFGYAEAPSTKDLNIGNDARAQMYSRGTQYKSFGSVLSEAGNDIWSLLGGSEGQKKIDDANRKLDEMAASLGKVGEKSQGAGDGLRKVVSAINPIGTLSLPGSISGGGGDRNDPTAGMKDIMPDMSGQIQAQTSALDSYKETWSAVAGAVGGAIQGIAKDLENGMSVWAAFGKAALMAAAQVARAALIGVVSNAMLAESKKGLPGILIGAAAGIAGISILEGLIQNIKAPKLAQGGMAFGPTMAVVGDNPNAHVDPEVISPLSKLKGMMAGGMGQKVDVNVTGQIAGDVIRLSAARSQNQAFRRGSANLIRSSNLITY
jgi:hypothetical protein